MTEVLPSRGAQVKPCSLCKYLDDFEWNSFFFKFCVASAFNSQDRLYAPLLPNFLIAKYLPSVTKREEGKDFSVFEFG